MHCRYISRKIFCNPRHCNIGSSLIRDGQKCPGRNRCINEPLIASGNTCFIVIYIQLEITPDRYQYLLKCRELVASGYLSRTLETTRSKIPGCWVSPLIPEMTIVIPAKFSSLGIEYTASLSSSSGTLSTTCLPLANSYRIWKRKFCLMLPSTITNPAVSNSTF